MLFLYNLITWTFDTYLRHILYAHFTNLLLFNRQIKVNIQIGNSKISCTKDFLVDVGKSLNDTTAANLLCDLAFCPQRYNRGCNISCYTQEKSATVSHSLTKASYFKRNLRSVIRNSLIFAKSNRPNEPSRFLPIKNQCVCFCLTKYGSTF